MNVDFGLGLLHGPLVAPIRVGWRIWMRRFPLCAHTSEAYG